MRALCVAILAAGPVACTPEPETEPRRCNGHAVLCDRPFDRVVLPATHNAMSNAEDAWTAPNHRLPPVQQLEDGVRAMLLDTYLWRDDVYLCHAYCELGATLLVDVLTQIRAFLQAHPDDVMLLVLQNSIDAATLDDRMITAGLDGLRYAHPPGEPWPTLAQMADAGTPLIVSVERPGDEDPPWHHDFYDIGFDTPYSFRAAEDFTCDVLRGSSDHDLFLLNHWLSTPLPTRDGAAEVNQAAVLGQRARDCTAQHGRPPNLVAVDHYDLGDLFAVVDELNGVESADRPYGL